MFIPNYFLEQDKSFIAGIIDTYDFATLVISKNDILEINHIPLIYYPSEGQNGVLKGHVAISNPVVNLLDDCPTATAIFNGPHCYISPRWYDSTNGHVPTWNYVVVHAHGKILKKTSPSWLKQVLTDIAQKNERGNLAWSADYSDKNTNSLLNGIVGIEIEVSELHAKSKLSQNRNEKDYVALLKNLKKSNHENARQVGALMESRELLNNLNKTTGELHHVEIYVSQLERSREFWSWFLHELGYSLFQEWDSGFSMKLKDTYIVFVQTKEKHLDIPYHRCKTGLNHLAFHGKSHEHIRNLKNKLKEKGINILYENKDTSVSKEKNGALYFEDPDRIKVEVVAQ